MIIKIDSWREQALLKQLLAIPKEDSVADLSGNSLGLVIAGDPSKGVECDLDKARILNELKYMPPHVTTLILRNNHFSSRGKEKLDTYILSLLRPHITTLIFSKNEFNEEDSKYILGKVRHGVSVTFQDLETDKEFLEAKHERSAETPDVFTIPTSQKSKSPAKLNIGALVLTGFFAVLGIAAVAVAFTLLHAATLGAFGVAVAVTGAAFAGMGISGFFGAVFGRNASKPLDLESERVADLDLKR